MIEYDSHRVALPYLCYTADGTEIWRISNGELLRIATIPNTSTVSINHDTGHIAWFDSARRVAHQITPQGDRQEFHVHVPTDVNACGLLAGTDIVLWYNQPPWPSGGTFMVSVSGEIRRIPHIGFLPTQGLFVVRAGKAIVSDAFLDAGKGPVYCVVCSDGVETWKDPFVSVKSFAPSIPQASICSSEIGKSEVRIIDTRGKLLGRAVMHSHIIANGAAVVEGDIAVVQFLHLIYVFRRDNSDKEYSHPKWVIPVVPSTEQVQMFLDPPYVYTACRDMGAWVIHVFSVTDGYKHTLIISSCCSPLYAVQRTVMKDAAHLCAPDDTLTRAIFWWPC